MNNSNKEQDLEQLLYEQKITPTQYRQLKSEADEKEKVINNSHSSADEKQRENQNINSNSIHNLEKTPNNSRFLILANIFATFGVLFVIGATLSLINSNYPILILTGVILVIIGLIVIRTIKNFRFLANIMLLTGIGFISFYLFNDFTEGRYPFLIIFFLTMAILLLSGSRFLVLIALITLPGFAYIDFISFDGSELLNPIFFFGLYSLISLGSYYLSTSIKIGELNNTLKAFYKTALYLVVFSIGIGVEMSLTPILSSYSEYSSIYVVALIMYFCLYIGLVIGINLFGFRNNIPFLKYLGLLSIGLTAIYSPLRYSIYDSSNSEILAIIVGIIIILFSSFIWWLASNKKLEFWKLYKPPTIHRICSSFLYISEILIRLTVFYYLATTSF